MNKRQKLVQEAFIDNEEAVIKRLKSVYNQSLKDINQKTKELQDQINALDSLQGMASDPEELAILQSMKQSKVYQKQYQEALKKQVSSILDNMQVEEFKTVDEYLKKCYEDGFVGVMYDLNGQGIPLCFPMDQESIVRAVQLDSKISKGLYSRLDEDIALLKRKITAQISRGISTGMTFAQVAKQLAAYTNIGFNNAVRIARTEGHRIQIQAGMDACFKAQDKGADVVKQWDSTLDKRTRKSHQHVDGEIRELDEPFSNGLMYPGDPSGGASEVVNCRCALLQRARWALDEDELQTLKDRAKYYGLDKADNFSDFKKKYLKAADEIQKQESKQKFIPAKTKDEAVQYAKQNFNVDADYSKYNIDVANAVNETMYKIQNSFGDNALNKLNRIGTFPKGYSTRYAGAYVKSSNTDLDGSLWLRNVGTKKSIEKLESVAKEQFDSGFWSTPEALHTIRHELGHAVHIVLGTDDINSKLTELRKNIVDERMKRNRSGDHNHSYSDWLSEYGMTNTSEFVAESIAEYLAGNPRETASKVVSILIGG